MCTNSAHVSAEDIVRRTTGGAMHRMHEPCVTTQEPTRPVKFMDRPKNSQSDCRVTACRMIGNLDTIQNSACGQSAPAARDCMHNGRESQY